MDNPIIIEVGNSFDKDQRSLSLLIKDPHRKQRGIQRNTYHTFYNETRVADLRGITRLKISNSNFIGAME